jgi:hypothetical protein
VTWLRFPLHPSCPDEVHMHFLPPNLCVVSGWVIEGRGVPLIVSTDETVAARVAWLLDRYGLVDVPDAPCSWPAPNPAERVR